MGLSDMVYIGRLRDADTLRALADTLDPKETDR
jgi:hypothetical protein